MTPTSHRSILLGHSYFLRYDAKQWHRARPYPPLGTLSVAATLRARGHDPAFFDAMLAGGVEEFAAALRHHRPGVVFLVEDDFNYLTKMCTTRMRTAALQMVEAAHRAGSRILVHGSDASDHAAAYLAAGADAVALGEPEQTVAEVAAAWTGGTDDLSGIAGLALPATGDTAEDRPLRTPARPYLNDLDHLPPPAWDLIDVERYRTFWQQAHGRFSWNAVTSRGCPYRCNWCAKPIFGTRWAQHSPARAADELARIKRDIAPDHIWFADDIFGLTERWIVTFAEEVHRRDAALPFMMQSRANLMTPPVVDALVRAGAEEVWLGAESGAQQILDAMDKGTTVQQVRDAVAVLHEHDLRVGLFVQLGYPGETWREILMTRDLIRDTGPNAIGVSVAYPLPGTVFHERVRSQLGHQTNWRDSNDLAMMFHGTYDTDFYRRVRTLLHAEVEPGAAPDCLDDRWAALAAERPEVSTPSPVAFTEG